MIERFLYDAVNLAKIAAHGITPEQTDAVIRGPYTFKRNRKGGNALYLVIGVDDDLVCITIAVDPTPERGVWRPRTAFPCKPWEAAKLPKGWSRR